MASQIVLMTVITLTVFLQIVFSMTTGTRENVALQESAKASELRKKLLQLQNMLQNYEQDNIFPKESNKPTKPVFKTAEDTATGDQHEPADENAPMTTASILNHLGARGFHAANHLEARGLQAEDMKRSLERDTDESDLQKLYQTKVRRDDDSVQILAKALAQLRDFPSQSNAESNGEYLRKSEESSGKVKDDRHQQLASNGQTMESYILDALKRLDNGQEGKEKERNKQLLQLPLFHNEDGGKDGHGRNQGKNKNQEQAVMVNDLYANNDQGYSNEDIINALIRGGYLATEKPSPQEEDEVEDGRSRALGAIETRLMEDIEAANEVGVSVKDLIEDLEDKAFKEAILERIHRIMRPR